MLFDKRNWITFILSLIFLQTTFGSYREFIETLQDNLRARGVEQAKITTITSAICDNQDSIRKIRKELTLHHDEDVDQNHLSLMLHRDYYYTIICMISSYIDKNFRFEFEDTMLHIAVQNRDLPLLRILLFNVRCDARMGDCNYDTPLHIASLLGFTEIILELLPYSDIDVKNKFGDTPLHLAVREIRLEALVLLAQNGASLEVKNKNNETPLELAKLLDHPSCRQIVEYLDSLSK